MSSPRRAPGGLRPEPDAPSMRRNGAATALASFVPVVGVLLVIYTSSALVWQATTEGRFEVDPETWRQFTGTAATRWHS